MERDVAVLGAPSAIGIVPYDDGRPRRLDLAPAALREHGLVRRVEGRDLGDVVPPQRYRDLVRPVGRCRNEDDVGTYSRELAERIARCRRERHFVLLVGGDCSIVLGALLALREVDTHAPGLVYVDAHADFATLEESPSGSACSMALALAVGRAERPLARLAGADPLVRPGHVTHIGRREHAEPLYGDTALEASGILDVPMSTLASTAPPDVARAALARAAAGGRPFWVHFDVDVLDPEVLPATGDASPGGIDFDAAAALVGSLIANPSACGLQVTLYDPTLDPAGTSGADLVGMLERVLRARIGR